MSHVESQISLECESYLFQADRLAFPSDVPKENRFMVMLQAYFDDSGTHDRSETVSVGGFISTPERWLKFEEEWRSALEDWGIPMFRMSKFANRARPFTYWTEEQRQQRLSRLLEVIDRNVLASIGAAIPVAEFSSKLSPEAQLYCGGPYGLAMTFIFMDLAPAVRRLHGEEAWIAYIVESGSDGAGEILKVFRENERDPQQKELYRLLSLRFENKRQYLPLQAADILAYELYKHHPRQPVPQHLARYPLRKLADIPRISWFVPSTGSLENVDLVLRARMNRDRNR